jgi:hypothetical protein
MDTKMIILRIVHVGCGVFWAGTMIFMALFIERAVRRAGPAGGAVMQEVMKLGYMIVMPVVAILTLVSGFWIYYEVSGGHAEWFRSRTGMTLGVGGMLALLAFLFGILVMRPTMMKVQQLAAAAQTAPPEQRDALMAQLAPLRARGTLFLRIVATMLGVVVLSMAVARYV